MTNYSVTLLLCGLHTVKNTSQRGTRKPSDLGLVAGLTSAVANTLRILSLCSHYVQLDYLPSDAGQFAAQECVMDRAVTLIIIGRYNWIYVDIRDWAPKQMLTKDNFRAVATVSGLACRRERPRL